MGAAAAAFLLLLVAGPAAPAHPDRAPHDLHISYGDLGIEGRYVLLRLRIFKDDLEMALAGRFNRSPILMESNPAGDAEFLTYFGERFELRPGSGGETTGGETDGGEGAAGDPLKPVLVDAGSDELDREPVWWYLIRFEAPGPMGPATVRNTLLFELFADQRNILKVVRFPEERQQTFYFAPGEEEVRVR